MAHFTVIMILWYFYFRFGLLINIFEVLSIFQNKRSPQLPTDSALTSVVRVYLFSDEELFIVYFIDIYILTHFKARV
jgi:hypothetical protein